MIRKVALVQAWREAFPEDYAGMYSEEEMGNAGQAVSEPQDNLSPHDADEIVDVVEVEESPAIDIDLLLEACKRAVERGLIECGLTIT